MRLHQSEYYLACVGGRALETGKLEIPLKPEAVAWSERYWQQHFLKGKPVMTLAPGSGAREKNWPDASFRAVADWWRRRTCGSVVVILGPVEEEKGDYTALCEGAVVARNLNLGKLAALLARSDLYLGNDSGVSHLAAALGVDNRGAVWPFERCPMGTPGQERHCIDSEHRMFAMHGLDDEKLSAPEVLDNTRARICDQEIGWVGGELTLTRGGVGITVNSEIPQVK